jgi:hypothetical protein
VAERCRRPQVVLELSRLRGDSCWEPRLASASYLCMATELMHYLLVPDIGRYQERLLAEGMSACFVSCLVARLVHISRERHRLTLARSR